MEYLSRKKIKVYILIKKMNEWWATNTPSLRAQQSNINKDRTNFIEDCFGRASLAMTTLLLLLSLSFSSCKKEEPKPDVGEFENAVFIVNEGNFTAGNASLTYFNHQSSEVEQQVFYRKNNAPLGDVANSINFDENSIYIVVNNSHLVYKINLNTGLYEAKTTQLTSPRHLIKIDENRALISDLYEKSLALVNTETMEIVAHIPIGRTSENMLKVGSEVFVANWSAYNQEQKNNLLMVVNIETLQLTDSIEVPLEPNSMVIDKDNNIWVLGSGGFLNEERPALWRIDPELKIVTKRFIFENINSSPTHLCINPERDKLYFLNKDVYQMDISTNLLSAKPFVLANETSNFYSLGVGPDADVYITDANDYTRNGIVYRYSSEGILKHSFEAGIIPGAIGFTE